MAKPFFARTCRPSALEDYYSDPRSRIHQPSAELFEVFDRLLLLRKGGQTVYFGDLGHHCHTLIGYFERNGARKCGPEENPLVPSIVYSCSM